jgi:predicted ribosome quality control (RQC) complex YloA/Tae2 family protein
MHEGQVPDRFTMPAGLAELMHELEQDWPAMQTALRSSGVPLNDEETDEEREAREKKEAEDAAAAKKPWGDDKDFDPEKAWKLIQNVRSDVDKLKTERDTLATKVREHEDATKSDTQKLEERASNAESGLSTAQRETARLRIALKKNLTETQAKRLVGDTEEELEADADELLASFKDDENDDGDGGGERRTPKPRMRTGAAPSSEAEETDPEKLAEQVPRR